MPTTTHNAQRGEYALYTPPPPEPFEVTVLEEYGEYALVETQHGAIHFAKKEHLTPNKEEQR